MSDIVKHWSSVGWLVRLAVLALSGLAWAVSSLHLVLNHPDYWDPVTAADYFAVYVYTVAWLLTAVSVLILREVARPGRADSTAILIVAAGCAVAGVANSIEDALGVRGFGLLYVIGAMVGGFGLFVVAALLWPTPARNLAFVPAVGGLAMVAVTTGGGAIALVAWGGFAAILIRERLRPATIASTGSPAR
jgi:hypothetical protein